MQIVCWQWTYQVWLVLNVFMFGVIECRNCVPAALLSDQDSELYEWMDVLKIRTCIPMSFATTKHCAFNNKPIHVSSCRKMMKNDVYVCKWSGLGVNNCTSYHGKFHCPKGIHPAVLLSKSVHDRIIYVLILLLWYACQNVIRIFYIQTWWESCPNFKLNADTVRA